MTKFMALDERVADTATDECVKSPVTFDLPKPLIDLDGKHGTVRILEAPVRQGSQSTCARMAFLFMFLALIVTVTFIGLRCFVARELRDNMERQGAYDQHDRLLESEQPVPFDSKLPRDLADALTAMGIMEPGPERVELLPSNKIELKDPSQPDSQSAATNAEVQHADNKKQEDEKAKSFADREASNDVSKVANNAEQGSSPTSNKQNDQPKFFWGFMRQSGIRIVNGRVVSQWDEMVPLGDREQLDSSEEDSLDSESPAAETGAEKFEHRRARCHRPDHEGAPSRHRHRHRHRPGKEPRHRGAPADSDKNAKTALGAIGNWFSEQFNNLKDMFAH